MKRKPARRKPKKSKRIISRSVRKNAHRVVVVSVLFTLSLVFLFSYSFHKYLNQNFASALSTSSYSILDDTIPTLSYIVVEDLNASPVVVKKVNFILFDKVNNKVSIYNVPVNTDYEIPGKYGRDEFSKLFALGAMNSNDPLEAGSQAINRCIFKLFGFKVDKFVLTDFAHESFFDKLWREGGFAGLLNLKSIYSLEGSLKTNMSLKEFNNLLSFTHSLPQDRVINETTTPKSFLNTQDFDDQVREITYDSAISNEKKNIAILNGTNYNGLASFGSRVVSNIGGRVVAVTNTESFYEKSVIIADDIDSRTALFLSRVFMIPDIIHKDKASSYLENEVDRSDVVVIFGFDTAGDLY
ncbi:LytR C-terminal domain-containing protein [candidate division WWE3 bacterium]|uniref:LytR C-terminal domain-containing protein n=1 Tax=candidate division WWE3 bacterium TaxID=2053526 RepID=A0A7X9HTX1_UNCKA|nr:LytR C-terminal domain-containing protein [candidate division WWE3 bacterium]